MHLTSKLQPTAFKNAAALILVGLLLGTLTLLIWSCNKSFGLLLDEGYTLLGAKFPHAIDFLPTSYQFYDAFLYHLADKNIVIFRLIGIALTLAAAPVLWLGSEKILIHLEIIPQRKETARQISLFCFISLGILLQYNWLYLIPTYNSLNALALNLGTGLLFILLSLLENPLKKNYAAELISWLLGLCIGFSFFVKFPTAISLFFLFSVILLIFPQVNFSTKLKSIEIITLGVFSWTCLHFLLLQPPLIWWENFHGGISLGLQEHVGHDLSAIKKYVSEFFQLCEASLKVFWLPYAVFLTGIFFTYIFKKSIFLPLLILIVFISTIIPSYQHDLLIGGGPIDQIINYYLAWVFLLSIIYTVTFFYNNLSVSINSAAFKKEFLICLTLFFLPITGAVGTINPIYINMMFTLAPWFVLLFFLLTKIVNLTQNPAIQRLGLIILGISAFIQITSGVLYHPYNIYTKLSDQNTPCLIGEPEHSLKLDSQSCKFITQYRHLAQSCGFKPGDNILSFYNFPGLVFVLGGKSPIEPWYFPPLMQAPIFINQALKSTDFKNAFIVVSTDDPELKQNLARVGIDLAHYKSCGSVLTPAQIPAPFGNKPMQLFKPN